MLWLRTLRLENFGSLGSRVVWFVYALRMSSHDVHALNCQSPNACRPFEIHINSIGPIMWNCWMSLRSWYLCIRSLYSANQFYTINDARKASKGAIRIQRELCMHEPAKMEFKSALSCQAKVLRIRHTLVSWKRGRNLRRCHQVRPCSTHSIYKKVDG